MSEKPDYRATVFLPKTDFPMKAGLPQKEPGILARWQAEDLYRQVRASRAGREKFILHDGPPYANGDMHIGHALNHILKDMVVRTQTLLGKDAPYVPGWDCHGLPIEWKVEEEYRKKKLNKDEVPAKEFRAECRAYAQHWVDTQREQFKRLGINGDWDNPYLTMDFEAEATIVSRTAEIRRKRPALSRRQAGDVVARSRRPRWPRPRSNTRISSRPRSTWRSRSSHSPIEELVGAYAVIWTTTPWTIPVNQALAYGPEVEYSLVDSTSRPTRRSRAIPRCRASSGRKLRGRTGRVALRIDVAYVDIECDLSRSKGSELAGTVARHPMHHLGGFFAEPRPFLAGDFVTTDSGTGLVHMAPDHGEDDFELCKAHGIEPKFAVEADGKYREDWLWLGGQGSVINGKFNAPDGPICEDLQARLEVCSRRPRIIQHSYPHSWRSKAKVIYRCTPQWFVPMDRPIAQLEFPVAPGGTIEGAIAGLGFGADRLAARPRARSDRRNPLRAREGPQPHRRDGRRAARLGAFAASAPGACRSRCSSTARAASICVDPEVNDRIVAAVREGGVDAWDEEHAQTLLGNKYKLDDYERIADILDVWFDSGSHPRLRARKRALARSAMAGRPLSRRQRPASRLVPVLAARKLRAPAAARPTTRC